MVYNDPWDPMWEIPLSSDFDQDQEELDLAEEKYWDDLVSSEKEEFGLDLDDVDLIEAEWDYLNHSNDLMMEVYESCEPPPKGMSKNHQREKIISRRK